MTDIVERLRDYATNGSRPWPGIADTFTEAADTIERLQRELAEARAQEREACAKLVESLKPCGCGYKHGPCLADGPYDHAAEAIRERAGP